MSPQAGWILQDEIAPRIAAVVPRSIQAVGAEDSQELVADGICMAAKMVDRLEHQGKLGKVSPGNVAFYCLQHLKSGRRAGGSSTVDAHGTQSQLNGASKLHSLSEVVSESECGNEIFELQDVISNDHEDPGTVAARRLDWDTLCQSLTQLEMLLIKCLVNGLGIREAAEIAHVSYWTMQDYRRKVAVKIVEFMGVEILCDIALTPGWKIGLDCERELLACRADRRAN
jgi:4-hydroxy-3-methylbut-2-en-1-yl diphosphate synthase IspG/GcpE